MVEKMVAFGIGFACGVIYTSNYYEKNPNEIFNHWGDQAVTGVNNIRCTVKKKFNDNEFKEVVE